MSEKEVDLFHLLECHRKGEVTLTNIACILGRSYRQIKRLWKRLKQEGKVGLVSRQRGRQSNRAFSKAKINEIIDLYKTNYRDFHPTLAAEKLLEIHNIKINRESLRKILILNELWHPKHAKQGKVYQRRPRRSSFGELIQMDGSPHDWFEGRAPRCSLLLAVDDATGNVMAGHFQLTEDTNGYFHLMRKYLTCYGRPRELYTDKYSVFRVNHGVNRQLTQFTRAMKELDIRLITAHSPQAKGRIERLNGVFQDRLVKELRLRNISSIEEGNVFLPRFLEDYNRRFAKKPANPVNAHRPLCHNTDLRLILCTKDSRCITKNLEVQYETEIFQINAPHRKRRLAGKKVTVIKTLDGEVILEFNGEPLPYKRFQDKPDIQPLILDHKELVLSVVQDKRYQKTKPSNNHPWIRGGSFLSRRGKEQSRLNQLPDGI